MFLYTWRITAHIRTRDVSRRKPSESCESEAKLLGRHCDGTLPSQINMSCHIYGCVTSHVWMSHVTHCCARHMSRDLTSQIWTSLVTYTDASCRTYVWPHTYVSHSRVSFTNESCHTYVALVICDQTSIAKSYTACIVSCTLKLYSYGRIYCAHIGMLCYQVAETHRMP